MSNLQRLGGEVKRSGKFVAVLEQTHCGSGITTMRVPLGYKVLEDVGE